MIRLKHYVFLTLIGLFLFTAAFAEEKFSDKEKTIIYTHSLNVIHDYQRLINEMGEYAISDTEAAQSSLESFLELFVNREVLIYNDLDPTHRLSAFYEAETYVSNLMLWYPDGMQVQMDLQNAKVGNIVHHEEDIYSLDIMLSKEIRGNYLNRTQNENTEDLLIRIAFNRKIGGFDNYKIVGIRNTDLSNIPDFNKNIDEVNAEDFDENDQHKMEEGMKSIIYDYVNYIALLGNTEEFEEDKVYYRQSFRDLFEDENVKLYNDLTPEPENAIISIEQYLTILNQEYPSGIRNLSIPVDSANIGKAIKSEKGFYYSTFKADKFFSGNFRDKQAFSEVFPLIVKVRFKKSGNAFTDFKIQSIDIETEDFYQTEKNQANIELPSISITTVSRKGLSIGFEAGYGQSYFDNQTMHSLTMDYDAHAWAAQPGYGLKAAANIHYYFNNYFGIKSGIEYNTIKSTLSLNGEYTAREFSEDANGVSYYKVIEASYDSAITLNQVAVPLVFSYSSGEPNRLGIFAELGIIAAYNLSSVYETTGSYEFYGFYPTHPPESRFLRIEELGFYEDKNIRRSGNSKVSPFVFYGYASAGLNIPLGYFSNLKLGPEVYYGLNDIDSGQEYFDIFGNPINRKPTILKKYGIKISYVLKL